jgi:hypothetical protein
MSQTRADEAKIHAESPVVYHRFMSNVTARQHEFAPSDVRESPPSGAVPLYGRDILYLVFYRRTFVEIWELLGSETVSGNLR